MLGPTSARRRAKLSAPKIVSPGCSSRQMRTPGAAVAAQADSSFQYGTTCSRNCHSQSGSSSQQSQETAKTPVESLPLRPPGQPLIVTTVSTSSRAASSIAPRIAACASARPAPRRRERIARGVDAGQALPMLAQLSLQPIALGGLCQQPRQVEVRPRRPGADAHLEVIDAPLGAPLERLEPLQVRQPVREQPDSQVALPRTALERSNKAPIEALARPVVKGWACMKRGQAHRVTAHTPGSPRRVSAHTPGPPHRVTAHKPGSGTEICANFKLAHISVPDPGLCAGQLDGDPGVCAGRL